MGEKEGYPAQSPGLALQLPSFLAAALQAWLSVCDTHGQPQTHYKDQRLTRASQTPLPSHQIHNPAVLTCPFCSLYYLVLDPTVYLSVATLSCRSDSQIPGS